MSSIHGLIWTHARLASIGLLSTAACAFIAAAGPAPAHATETALYTFTGPSGAYPQASLTADTKGNLYGTTSVGGSGGGAFGFGVVFMLTPPASAAGAWTETVLYNFAEGTDGGQPHGNVIFDAQGSLYGTATCGGLGNGNLGYGVVYKLTPPASGSGPWTETVLHSFGRQPDGAFPSGGLIFDAYGSLYGTTAGGGAKGEGTVFKLKPPTTGMGPWTETILHNFEGKGNGAQPNGNLIFDAKGALYGTTTAGGNTVNRRSYGTVFKLTPPSPRGPGPWTETVLHKFASPDGAYPSGSLIFDAHGALYGATYSGSVGSGSTVFKLSPPAAALGKWTEEILSDFEDSNPAEAAGSVIFDTQGNLYGVANWGGSNSAGAVYSLTPPASGKGTWTLGVLYNFDCQSSSGCYPNSSLISPVNGTLYGTAYQGGPANEGAVFQLQCSQWSGTGAAKTCVGW
ncbi:MAG: choice-of-anchor tandem repeat GloVer-containing protein [Rhodomicrobium sp.]